MKKLFFFVAALMTGTSMFAALTPYPSTEILNGYKQAGQNLVYAIYVEDSIKCNDIVLWGTYNSWSENAEACSKFVAVPDYAGWYVCCVADASEDIQAKPVQLKSDGSFSKAYQVGALVQENVVKGTATVVPGYNNECDIKAISDAAPVLINVTIWKTRCERQTAIESVKDNSTSNNQNARFIRNGHLYIRRGDILYNAKGQVVK